MGWVESLRADDPNDRAQESAEAPDELFDDYDDEYVDDLKFDRENDPDWWDHADAVDDRAPVIGRGVWSRNKREQSRRGGRLRREPVSWKTVLVVSGAITCLLVIVLLGAKAVFGGSTGVSGSVADPTRSMVVGSCPDAVDAPEEGSTLAAAVAQFEQAYYSRDEKSLLATLTPSSALREQNWKDVLTKAAPQGTRWCATVTPTPADSVVTVVVSSKTPEGDLAVYTSTVTGERIDGAWKITKFETATPKPGAPGAMKEKE